jgi:hypothetical protein
MKRIFLSVLLLLLLSFANAQVKLYKTYEDYEAKKFVEFVEFKYTLQLKNYLYDYLRFVDANKQTVAFKTIDYWGFEYKGCLFRILPRTNSNCVSTYFVRLLSKGKICYYENGAGHLEALYMNKKKALYDSERGKFFFSKDLNSIISEDQFGECRKNPSHQQLFAENKEYEPLYDCLIKDCKDKADKYPKEYVTDYKLAGVKKPFKVQTKIAYYIEQLKFEYVRNCVKQFNADTNNLNEIELKL